MMFRGDQRRVLNAMGIDVWVRRGAAPAVPATVSGVESHTAPAPPRGTPAGSVPSERARGRTSVRPQREAALRVHLECLYAPHLALVGEIRSGAETRLANDIVAACAGALAGTGWARPARLGAFRWPQTSRGDQGLAACRQAFTAFLRGSADRHGITLVLVAGASAVDLLAPEDEHAPPVLWSRGSAGSLAVVPVPSLAELLGEPTLKQKLWQSVTNSL
jgi:hypothetical protein